MAKVPKQMSLGDLLGLQKRMEDRMAVAVQEAIREFQAATGMTPCDVSVYLVAHHRMDEPRPDYLVDKVVARLDLIV